MPNWHIQLGWSFLTWQFKVGLSVSVFNIHIKKRNHRIIDVPKYFFILSRKYYEFVGRKGAYTRKRGLDRETNKQLLLKHIKENKKQGSQLRDLLEVLPSLTRDQVKRMIAEMKKEKAIYVVGKTSAARWYPGSDD
jgi:hypothetical protein